MSESASSASRTYDPRNFRLCVWNGALAQAGIAFFAVETVLAGLTESLTGSSLYVGLLITVSSVGWMWPQLFVGHIIETKELKMPAYLFSARSRFIFLLLMSVALGFWRGSSMTLYWLILLLMGLYSSSGGIVVLPFLDIVVKTVSRERMAMLWAYRRVFGGAFGFIASLIATYVLSERSGIRYPMNYAVLLFMGALVSGVAYYTFVIVKEPRAPAMKERSSFWSYLNRGPVIFRRDHDYRRMFLLRCAWAVATMSQAVFVPCAVRYYQAPPEHTGGWFTSVILLAGGVSSFAWGRAVQRYGESRTIRWSSAMMFLSPLTACALTCMSNYEPTAAFAREHYFVAYVAMYALSTAAISGNDIAAQTYLLALPPSELRPTYLAFINTLTVPLLFAPTLAGFLAERISYPATFALSCISAVVAFGLASRLRPRMEGEYPIRGDDYALAIEPLRAPK